MDIQYTDINNVKLTFDHGFLVLEKAFKKDGVFHDIVVSDGDRQFQPGQHLDSDLPDLKARIQTIFAACVNANAAAQNMPQPESAYFVYTKTPLARDVDLTQTKAITAQGAQPLEIGTCLVDVPGSTIDARMAELAGKLMWYKEYNFNIPHPQAIPVADAALHGPAPTGVVAPQSTAPHVPPHTGVVQPQHQSSQAQQGHVPAAPVSRPKRLLRRIFPNTNTADTLTPAQLEARRAEEKRLRRQPKLAQLGGGVRDLGANGNQVVEAVENLPTWH